MKDGAANPPDVTVIGAGIVGMSCALYLQRAGYSVAVIDRGPPGAGCSSGNAGILATYAVVPVGTPEVLRRAPAMLFDPSAPFRLRWSCLPRLAPWLVRFALASRRARVERISLALSALAGPALDAYAPLLDDSEARGLVRHEGWLYVYETEAGFAADRDAIDLRRRRGVRVEIVDGAELGRIEPALAPGFAKGALLPDTARATNPRRLVERFAAHFAARGGALLTGDVTGFEIGPDGPRRVMTREGGHPASRVVLAAGAYSRPLAKALGARVPLTAERGYHVMLPNPGVTLRIGVTNLERAFAVNAMEDGLRVAGTVELAGLRTPPDYSRADVLLGHARRMFPGLDGRNAGRWMGDRPSLPDSLPVIGRSRRFANSYFAFGHGHLGLTFGPVTGKLVADLVAGRPPDVDPAPYRADRF